jgi:hypothetical protein
MHQYDHLRTINLINAFLDKQFRKSEQKVDYETFQRYSRNIAQKIVLDPEKERPYSIIHYVDFIKNYWCNKGLLVLDNHTLRRLGNIKEGIEKRIKH